MDKLEKQKEKAEQGVPVVMEAKGKIPDRKNEMKLKNNKPI